MAYDELAQFVQRLSTVEERQRLDRERHDETLRGLDSRVHDVERAQEGIADLWEEKDKDMTAQALRIERQGLENQTNHKHILSVMERLERAEARLTRTSVLLAAACAFGSGIATVAVKFL